MLERILIKYFKLNEEKDLCKAYSKLIELIYDLGELGVIENTNEIVDELDKIDSMEEV